MSSEKSNDDLFKVSKEEYGPSYTADFLTMYQDYVASADAISQRRHTANTFFLSVNTGLLGLTGYLKIDGKGLVWLAAAAAVLFSYTWLSLIASYKSLNSAKFAVILDMEQRLPVAPYGAEWIKAKSGAQPHVPFSSVESWVPKVFMALHSVVFYFSFKAWLAC